MARQCGYCAYMDISKIKDGQFKCEKNSEWKFANSDEAERCYKYCERFRKDMHLGDQAIKESISYIESHQSYTAVGCYITTIIVNILCLKDNCYELEVLRAFRKEYMQKTENCKDLLIKYDTIGPLIAKMLIKQENAQDLAFDLFTIYIKGAVLYIKQGYYDKAVVLYTEMMNKLINMFICRYSIGNNVIDNYDINSSGHGRLVLK